MGYRQPPPPLTGYLGLVAKADVVDAIVKAADVPAEYLRTDAPTSREVLELKGLVEPHRPSLEEWALEAAASSRRSAERRYRDALNRRTWLYAITFGVILAACIIVAATGGAGL